MPKTETYRDEKGEWRWRRKADNGEVVATSGEGYVNKGHAVEAAVDQFPDDDHETLEDADGDAA